MKALGVQLGMFVLVFCCDETFDFQAMGRIFIGLCRVGAWGCFDEFNRLEERILSAVSQQVQSIQHGLAATMHNPNAEIELVGKNIKINGRTGIFITTNPTVSVADAWRCMSVSADVTVRGPLFEPCSTPVVRICQTI